MGRKGCEGVKANARRYKCYILFDVLSTFLTKTRIVLDVCCKMVVIFVYTQFKTKVGKAIKEKKLR